MKNLEAIREEIAKCKVEQKDLQDQEENIIDKNDYMARNACHYKRIQIAARIDALYWVWENY